MGVYRKFSLGRRAFAEVGGVTKFVSPLVKPPAMPQTGPNGSYEIAVQEFSQQILPPGCPLTPVWSYGPAGFPPTLENGYFYPAFTIENRWRKQTEVTWINGLEGKPHLLPVDPTLHWANPIGDTDSRPPMDPSDDYWSHPYINNDGRYVGPVPMVTHVHGAHTEQQWDGYPEAWYLPASAWGDAAITSPRGTWFDIFNPGDWGPGFATFRYRNDQRASTLWYHDHTLGMTRVNVYAGPAGFYLIRGGPDDIVRHKNLRGGPAKLPGPAPQVGDDPFGTYYEIPIAIQDRSFNGDGSLFYPDSRAFFDDFGGPYYPYTDVAPIWQPEFFGTMMVVNGQTWPYLEVEQQQYRFRLLNGCNSRFLILDFNDITNARVWQIGTEGGFLRAPVDITGERGNILLMGPAERADIIVDFRDVPTTGADEGYVLANLGPDEPFGGGDFTPADPASTGQVMQFRVVQRANDSPGRYAFTDPGNLVLPSIRPIAPQSFTRDVSLNEEESSIVDADGQLFPPDGPGDPENPAGPTAALLGTLDPHGFGIPLLWKDDITENPQRGTTETWRIHNFTADAHPIHIHQVQFQVVGRGADGTQPPEPEELGLKDTVIAYPGEITSLQAWFDLPGRFVWHCHIVEHEDNEMMRPFEVVP